MSLPAAEVAADFRDALQDLRMNSRPEISNLTLIAKENTEYAEAISNELQKHIQSVSLEYITCWSDFIFSSRFRHAFDTGD